MDDNDAPTQCLDIGHVVAGEQDSSIVTAVVFGDEVRMRRWAVTSRPIVGSSRKRIFADATTPCNLNAHPFTQRQIAHRLGDQIGQIEQVDQFVERLRETALREFRKWRD